MSYSWDDSATPVFSRTLRRRRRLQWALVLLGVVIAAVAALSLVPPIPAPRPASSGPADPGKQPSTSAATDVPPESAATPGKATVSPPDSSAASAPGVTASPVASNPPTTLHAQSTDVIREPVLEAAAAGLPVKDSTASASADPSVRAAAEVRQALQAWADRWSQRDFSGYVAAYVPGFKGRFSSHSQWRSQRQARIVPRQHIRVVLTDVVITVDGPRARVDFRQLYASDNWQDDTRRTIEMRKTGDLWLIAGESER